ncbi:MAG: LytTR family transcriptional regulator DNA-binding domain-containing protein [Prevotella sp.]|jgi:hypothetical protein|nr:LytTR family transcriptional regulator DNA-binding domain-containing protein [Prevotella sp.]
MENQRLIYIHIFIAIATALVLYICTKPVLDINQSVIITDVAISGVILSGLIFILKNIVKYTYSSLLHFRQQIINTIALAILFVICWLGVEYLIIYTIFDTNEWNMLLTIIPFKVAIAILIYILIKIIYSKEEEADDEAINMEKDYPKIENKETSTIPEIVERITVKSGQKIEIIPISEIVHIQAEGDYVMIYSLKGKFLKEQTMKSLESTLPSDRFVRIHRSNIINVNFIAQIELFDKQSQLLKLKDGTHIKISQAGYRNLKAKLGL